MIARKVNMAKETITFLLRQDDGILFYFSTFTAPRQVHTTHSRQICVFLNLDVATGKKW